MDLLLMTGSGRPIRIKISSEVLISIKFFKRWLAPSDSEVLKKFFENPTVRGTRVSNFGDQASSGGLSFTVPAPAEHREESLRQRDPLSLVSQQASSVSFLDMF